MIRFTRGLSLALGATLSLACALESDDLSTKGQELSLCGTYDTVDVLGKKYVINNNVWNGTGQCIEASSGSTAFTVTQANHNLPTNGPPASYASIFEGCHWNNCTSGSPMPVRVNALPALTSSWSISPAGGAWDAAYDIWFDTSPTPTGQPNHVEMMIWMDHEGGPQPFGTMRGTVNVAGAAWELWEGPMAGWRYVAYRRVQGTTSVTNLDLKAFVTDSVNRGYLSPTSYMVTIEAGFEIWKGGQGLRSESFSTTFGGSGGTGGTGGSSGGSGGGATGGGSSGGSGGASGGSCSGHYEAESITKSTGGPDGNAWNIWANGNVSTNHTFTSSSGTIAVRAKGQLAGSAAPRMEVRVGGTTVGSANVSSTSFQTYNIPFSGVSPGSRQIQVAFTNDYNSGGADRNLIVDYFDVSCSGGTTPPAASCTDGVRNQNETGVDCGGVCQACAPVASCNDGIRNQNETGVDCGGVCGACAPVASCNDGIRNQNETGVDCGGVCGACAPVASCNDGIRNQNETGVDCGGVCGACAPVASCNDGIRNQNETGVDCGGVCGACAPTGGGGVTAAITLTNNWSSGYCADLKVSSSTAISNWTAAVNLNQSTLANGWNATFTTSGSTLTAKPLGWNSNIPAGGSVTVGFCANKTGSNSPPTVGTVSGQ